MCQSCGWKDVLDKIEKFQSKQRKRFLLYVLRIWCPKIPIPIIDFDA